MSRVVALEGMGASVAIEVIGPAAPTMAADLAVDLQNDLAVDAQVDLAVSVAPRWIGASAVVTLVVSGQDV